MRIEGEWVSVNKEVGVPNNVEPAMKAALIGTGHDSSTELASYTPGSAIIYKGEPTATELGMLRFGLTSAELKNLNDIVVKVMEGYGDLGKSVEGEVRKNVDTVVKRIKENKLEVPLRIDYSAPDGSYSTKAEPSSSSRRASRFMWLLRRLNPRQDRQS